METVLLSSIAVLAAIAVVLLVVLLLQRGKGNDMGKLVELTRSEIAAEKEDIRKNAQERDESFRKTIQDIRQELAVHRDAMSATEKERVGEFKTLTTVMDEYKVVTQGLKSSTDDLKNLLSNNQMRGAWGEEVAENLLQSVGFVRGQYTVNEAMATSPNRPDITIRLPQGQKVNIDAKFPFKALVKRQETEDQGEKRAYWKQFETDVKDKIKQVRSRDYINPEEDTVDFVILFVPTEAVFSVIYNNLHEVWEDAMRNKVIIAGPISFTAILRMIYQSYKNFTYQENLLDIIKLIKAFEGEYEKFSEALDTLGARMDSAQKQFEQVSVTRTKKLTSVVEKIRQEGAELGEGDKPPALPE